MKNVLFNILTMCLIGACSAKVSSPPVDLAGVNNGAESEGGEPIQLSLVTVGSDVPDVEYDQNYYGKLYFQVGQSVSYTIPSGPQTAVVDLELAPSEAGDLQLTDVFSLALGSCPNRETEMYLFTLDSFGNITNIEAINLLSTFSQVSGSRTLLRIFYGDRGNCQISQTIGVGQ